MRARRHGERLRGLEVDGIVQHDERSKRRVRAHAPHRAGLAARRVERDERGIRRAAAQEGVDRAAVAVLALARPPRVARVDDLPHAVGLRRHHGRPADLARQEPAHRKRRVADLLGLEPHAWRARPEPVVRVALERLGRHDRNLAVGRAQHDLAQQRLRRESTRDEHARKVVKQRLVARARAHHAEILARLDDAAAEEQLPRAVRGHARKQRVVGARDPARHAEAVGGLRIATHSAERGRHRRRNFLLWARQRPARQQMRLSPRFRSEFAQDRRTCLDAPALDLEPRRVVVAVGVLRLVEVRQEAEVLAVRERVVRMPVALHALEGDAEERLPGRRDAVEHRGHAELLVVGAAFGVRQRVAVERGREAVGVDRVRHHVARKQPHRELVVRHVGVERVDHPVAPRPDVAAIVLLVALRVGVAPEVHPHAREAFAIRGAREQCVDEPLVRIGPRVGEKRLAQRLVGRQPREVERHAPRERRAVGLGRRRKPSGLEPREHEAVERPRDPRRTPDRRHRGLASRQERPVRAPRGALFDPALDHAHFRRRQRRPLGRHAAVRVVACDARKELARGGVPRRHRGPPALERRRHARMIGEVEPGHLADAAVAAEALRREDRQHILREVDWHRLRGAHRVDADRRRRRDPPRVHPRARKQREGGGAEHDRSGSHGTQDTAATAPIEASRAPQKEKRPRFRGAAWVSGQARALSPSRRPRRALHRCGP